MSLIYRSERVGKNGRVFTIYKIRTLKEKTKSNYNHEDNYAFLGRLLRKFRIDEIPQLWNVLRGDMNFVGPRPQELKTISLYPTHIKRRVLSVKPGMFGLAGLYFMNEERILTLSNDPAKDYWEKIVPLKITLDLFYVENRCFSLDCWIIYQGIKRGLSQLWN